MASGATTHSAVTTSPVEKVISGRYMDVVSNPSSLGLIQKFITSLRTEGRACGAEESGTPKTRQYDETNKLSREDIAAVGISALNAFLQANVTGPALEGTVTFERQLLQMHCTGEQEPQTPAKESLAALRRTCFKSLDVDGVSPYPYIPHIELFCLARFIFSDIFPADGGVLQLSRQGSVSVKVSIPWMRLRIRVWHYKLLTQPNLGPSSTFIKSSQWSDVPTLAGLINDGLQGVRDAIFGDEVWSTTESWGKDEKVQLLIELANYYIILGRDDRAREALREAAELNEFAYGLSGALGKRTKYQEKSTSQLVVLAKSNSATVVGEDDAAKPETLPLNDDTLLGSVDFTTITNGHASDLTKMPTLPPALAGLDPGNQPQLSSLDHIILLTEATLKDSFSPVDMLTSEEVLPYAERVISDQSTNWQIFTQALLVRSRIEMHRSRTIERGVLQMQAVVDQVVVDAVEAESLNWDKKDASEPDIPSIEITAPGVEEKPDYENKPTSFFRAAKSSESAPPQVRLQYIHTLASPPRWHLESELAYAWAGVGSLVSALEIFKRLRLWAEVALCYASSAAKDDEDGRGSGGEEKARTIIRWRLFHRTGEPVEENSDPGAELGEMDIVTLKPTDFEGPLRNPPPPNTPRLLCILGDLEPDSAIEHYTLAWQVSSHRYARAQKLLGEHYLQRQDWTAAREAYSLAVGVNRLSPEMWSRLGDINLRLSKFEEAADAFGRAIGAAGEIVGGEDARTWSNLGSALWSLHIEAIERGKTDSEESNCDEADRDEDVSPLKPAHRDPDALLTQSLAAYKRGASIAHDNWRIWDNVLTLASRMRPPAIAEMVQALYAIIRIRNSEDALDDDLLRALLQDAVLSKEKEDSESRIYDPPRGSTERSVTTLFEESIRPLITTRSSFWELISRLRVWRRDYVGALDAAEKAWRAAVGSASGGLLPSTSSAGESDWLVDREKWETVVRRTDELVSALENWGPEVETVGDRWRSKARSAVQSVMGRAKENWDGSEGWTTLERLLEGLKK